MIRFEERFIPAILDGTKTMTVRLEDKRRVGEIEALVVSYNDDEPAAWIQYTDKQSKQSDHVDVSHEGFTHVSDLIRYLESVYGRERVYASRHVWQYTFKVVDEPKIK